MIMLLIPLLPTALSAPSGWTNIAPGIDYAAYTNSLPAKIYALKINMCTPGMRIRATAEADRGQRTSSWAESVGATAAINGGFFKWGSYEPDGVAAGHGEIWSTSDDYYARSQIIFAEHLLEFIPAGESYVSQLPDWAEEAVNGDALLVNGGVVNDHGGTRRARRAN